MWHHWVLGLMGVATLILVIWMFVLMTTQQATRRKGKFFATRSPTPDFACALVDWDHSQVSLLGEHIPFQTVDLTKTDDKRMTFEFHATSGNVAYGEYLSNNTIILHDNNTQLILYSENPKTLMKDVAEVYQSMNEQRAFRPKNN
jgi:hypothetical protein